MPSHLADLIIRQTQTSVVTTVSRTVDRVADKMADELLRDPAFRTKMRALIEAAFAKALEDLTAEVPPPPPAP